MVMLSFERDSALTMRAFFHRVPPVIFQEAAIYFTEGFVAVRKSSEYTLAPDVSGRGDMNPAVRMEPCIPECVL